MQISAAIDEIAIHTHLLNISSVEFTLSGSNVGVAVRNLKISVFVFCLINLFSRQNYVHDEKMEQLKIKLTDIVAPTNNSKLNINFDGSLQKKIVGFYRSSYTDSRGNDR